MKKLIISLFLILATASNVLAMSYNNASKQGKPIVVMFHSHHCGACRQLSPIFDSFASKFSKKFNFVKEDVDSSRIASKFSFSTIPALFIVDPKTNSSKRISDDCTWDNKCFQKTLENY